MSQSCQQQSCDCRFCVAQAAKNGMAWKRNGIIPAGSATGDPGWAGIRCREVGRGTGQGEPATVGRYGATSCAGCRAMLSERSYRSSTVAVPC